MLHRVILRFAGAQAQPVQVDRWLAVAMVVSSLYTHEYDDMESGARCPGRKSYYGLASSRISAPTERWRDVGQDRFHDMRIVIHTELVGDR